MTDKNQQKRQLPADTLPTGFTSYPTRMLSPFSIEPESAVNTPEAVRVVGLACAECNPTEVEVLASTGVLLIDTTIMIGADPTIYPEKVGNTIIETIPKGDVVDALLYRAMIDDCEYEVFAVVHYNKGKPVKVALFSHEYMEYLRKR